MHTKNEIGKLILSQKAEPKEQFFDSSADAHELITLEKGEATAPKAGGSKK